MIAPELAVQMPELWLGVECTVNRVGDNYSDQLERSGHAIRIKDLERLAELGVRTIRYPVLWERTAPESLDRCDWSWSDERLHLIRRLGLRPIAGLVHHGSGPSYTNLLDPEFPEKLATYAAAVARRYPWITDYTPVNEPLTTARFSCLYGHWYPHHRDPLSFAKALLAQLRGVVLSMSAIRDITPAARLIQTEDLGKTFSTTSLAYQAEFENERRWLTFDLLCGRVTPGTAMWEYLRWLGIEARDLEWFLEHRCPPDLVGLNHYITSERFLDERLNRYPAAFHGGNGRHVYADVEAVRVCAEGVAGPKAIMREAWERYQLPLAITEVHLGCTREEQLRWLNEVWNASLDLSSQGVDINAVTVWAAGPECLAKECAERKVSFVTFSSDLVFDGLKTEHYIESDQPAPLNVYGTSKAEAEARVLDRLPEALVIRTSAFFGPWDSFNFVHAVLNTLRRGRPFVAADDLTISPTYVPDLVNATLDLLVDGEHGIWHLANSGSVTWADFARIVAEIAGYDPKLVHSRPSRLMDFRASRPAFTAMSSERANLMPSLAESLDRYFEARQWNQRHRGAAVQY